MKLDVAERLSRAADRYLVLGGSVGVVEGRPGCPTPGHKSQIVDRQRIVEATLNTIEAGLAESDQRREITRVRHSPFDHCATVGHMESASDPFDLQRFVDAQAQ